MAVATGGAPVVGVATTGEPPVATPQRKTRDPDAPARIPLCRLAEEFVRVSLLVTCLGDALFPEVGMATVRLLRRLGHEVDFPPSQTCCGQPHFNSGYHADARALARHTLPVFPGNSLVVAPSAA